jgi:hypothetical protein
MVSVVEIVEIVELFAGQRPTKGKNELLITDCLLPIAH